MKWPLVLAFLRSLHILRLYVLPFNTPHHLDWWKSVCTEFENCENKEVWTVVKKSNVPRGRKIIGNRWVFARKDDGRFRARTVAKGFSQITGQDFQEHHAPVINDTT
jgi:Reverse transcriptase (RNA-dependent DNA polymerase)